MKWLSLALCAGSFLATPLVAEDVAPVAGSPDATVRLRFDNQPLASNAVPQFSCKSQSSGQWVSCQVTQAATHDGYEIKGLLPGSYLLHIEIDDNPANPARYPGDYDVFFPFTTGGAAPLDIDLPRLLHVTAPWDNNRSIDGMLNMPGPEKPYFSTPKFSLTHHASFAFSWDPILPDAEYEAVVLATNDSTFQRGPIFLRKKTTKTSVTLSLPPSPEGTFYELGLSASHGGKQVGQLFTNEGGAQAWTLMFIVRDESLPVWMSVATVLFSVGILLACMLPAWPRGARYTVGGTLGIALVAILFKMASTPSQELGPHSLAAPPHPTDAALAEAFQQAVPKPAWWDSTQPAPTPISTFNDLMSLWNADGSNAATYHSFYKTAYQAVVDHSGDGQLVPMAIDLMSHTADPHDRRPLLEFGVDHYLSSKQSTTWCANCMAGDKAADLAQGLAEVDVADQKPDDAIALIDRLLRERGPEISPYHIALIDELKASAYWSKLDKPHAIESLQAGLAQFPVGWQADRLRKTLAHDESSEPTRPVPSEMQPVTKH